jgi:hypothetical protein
MRPRLVPVLLVVVLLVTSPVAGVTAAAQPDAGDGSSGGAGGAAGSGSASGSTSADGGSGTVATETNETVLGVGVVRAVATTGDGGRYLAGSEAPREIPNATLTRTGLNGSVVWQRSLGTDEDARAAVAVASTDSAVYLLQRVGPAGPPTDPTTRERPEAVLTRVTPDGSVVWNRSLGNASLTARGVDLVADADGATVVRTTESSDATARTERATELVRYAPDGSVDWARTYTGGQPRALARGPNGDYLVGGQREFRQGWFLRVDADGETLVNRTLGSRYDRRVVTVVPTGDGALLGGGTDTRDFVDTDPWVARVDADGVVEWSRTYGTAARERVRDAVTTDRGVLLVADRRPELGDSRTMLVHVTDTGTAGSRTVAGRTRPAAVAPPADGAVDLYGVDFDRENRTVVGTVRTVDLPTVDGTDLTVHDTLASNTTFDRGQNLRLPGDSNATHDLYRLPPERSDREEPRLVRRVTVGPETTIETATLPTGRYALRAAPGYWLRAENGRYSLTESPEDAAFELDEQRFFRPEPNRTVVETYEGERSVSIRFRTGPESFTARTSLRRLNGTDVDRATLADALETSDHDGAVFTQRGQVYGTVPVASDRNLTLDAGALPAGLYELTVTANETADATDPASTRLVVIDEERNVTLTPVNRTLSASENGSATTALRLEGADDGLGAVRVEAERSGPPAVRLQLGLGDEIDAGSASGGSRLGPGRAGAHTQTLDVRSAPNGSFVVARLTVESSDFDRRDEDETGSTPDTQTIDVGLAFAVDADGIPYSVPDRTTVTFEETDEGEA